MFHFCRQKKNMDPRRFPSVRLAQVNEGERELSRELLVFLLPSLDKSALGAETGKRSNSSFFRVSNYVFPLLPFLSACGTNVSLRDVQKAKQEDSRSGLCTQTMWNQQCLLSFLCVAEIVHSFVLFIYYRCKLFS